MTPIGEWVIEHANGSTRIVDFGDPISEAYFLNALRELATREHAATSPVGVSFWPRVK